MMNYLSPTEVRITQAGLVIPPDWLTGLTEDLCVRRFQKMLIIETRQQTNTREQLIEMAGKLRQVADEIGVPDDAENASLRNGTTETKFLQEI